MGTAENKALVGDWVDALAKGDVERIVAKYDRALVYERCVEVVRLWD